MSGIGATRRLMLADNVAMKGRAPIVCLTAYTTPAARMIGSECDVVSAGDSVRVARYGLPATVGVTMEMMILPGRAVARALRAVDMPFGRDDESPEQAVRNAARLMAAAGAGPDCDGRALVNDDMPGSFGDLRSKFVQRYAERGAAAPGGVAQQAAEVRAPVPEYSFADEV